MFLENLNYIKFAILIEFFTCHIFLKYTCFPMTKFPNLNHNFYIQSIMIAYIHFEKSLDRF